MLSVVKRKELADEDRTWPGMSQYRPSMRLHPGRGGGDLKWAILARPVERGQGPLCGLGFRKVRPALLLSCSTGFRCARLVQPASPRLLVAWWGRREHSTCLAPRAGDPRDTTGSRLKQKMKAVLQNVQSLCQETSLRWPASIGLR